MEPIGTDIPLYTYRANVYSYGTKQNEKSDSTRNRENEFQTQINRDVIKYRLKYLCNCSAFCRYSHMRIPSGKAVKLVLVMLFLERLAYFATLGITIPAFLDLYPHIPDAVESLVESLSLNIFIHLMFPVFGWIADAWIGRYRMIHLSLWVLFIAYAAVAFLFSIEASLIGRQSLVQEWRNILPVLFVVINIGASSFLASAIPFGADQIADKASEELSSYFYAYYFVYNLSATSLVFTFSCKSVGIPWHGIVYGLVSVSSITVALSLNATLKNWLLINPEKRNPIKMIGKVYCSAVVAKRPQHRSAFSYNSRNEPPSRIDLVKERHGGKFSSEEVEDAKTFGRLLIVLLAVVGTKISYSGVINVMPLQLQNMNKSLTFESSVLGHCTVSDSFVWMVNIAVILITIPILNQCIFPFLRNYTPNMLKRIGIGCVLIILSVFALVVTTSVGQSVHYHNGESVEAVTNSCMFRVEDMEHPELSDQTEFIFLPINSFMAMLPQVLLSLAEVFLNVSSLEFFYAQSPHTLRGLMIGFVFFAWGFGGTISNVLIGAFSLVKVGLPMRCELLYYIILLLISIVGFVIYVFVARWYKNRRRPEESEDELFYNTI